MPEPTLTTHRTPLLDEVERFLVLEAELIDGGRFGDWLELFTDDAIYWWPLGDETGDTAREVSLLYDDRRRMTERVLRIETGHAYAQDPPSRVLHTIGNVRVDEGDPDGPVVRSNQIVVESRRGVQSVFAASVEHVLQRQGASFAIARKTVSLLNRDSPLANLTFLF